MHPQHSKATITACGRSFGPLSLLYHFVGNSLNCPCCRAGSSDATLTTKCLPVHLRSAFARQVRNQHLAWLTTNESKHVY